MAERLYRILQRPAPRRMPQPPPASVTRPHPGCDQRLEDRIQPHADIQPSATRPRLATLRPAPPMTDSHKARTNSWVPSCSLPEIDPGPVSDGSNSTWAATPWAKAI